MTAESIWKLIQFAVLVVSLFGAWWVWQDAKRLKQNGAEITPGLWAAVVFLACGLGLPVYMLLRWILWRDYQSPLQGVAKEFE